MRGSDTRLLIVEGGSMEKSGKSLYIRVIEILSNMSLAFMFVIVMFGVISRYVMSSPYFWSDELSRYLMIYMVFLGSTLSFREEKHPSLTFLIDKLSPKRRAIWDLLIDLLLISVLIMLISGGLEIMTHKPIGRTPALRIKYTWVYLAMPLGGSCMIIEIILRMSRRLKNLHRHSS